MSGIEKLGKKMKVKMSFDDYEVSPSEFKKQPPAATKKGVKVLEQIQEKSNKTDSKNVNKSTDLQDDPLVTWRSLKKNRVGFHFPDKELEMLDKIYTTRLMNKQKMDRSQIVCEAIRLLYEQEEKLLG